MKTALRFTPLSRRSLLRYCLPLAWSCWSIIAITSGRADDPHGIVEGIVKIVSQRAVELEGDHGKPADADYTALPLMIWNADQTREIMRLTTDASGSYRATLSPGRYRVGLDPQARQRFRGEVRGFTVEADRTVRVDLEAELSVPPQAPSKLPSD